MPEPLGADERAAYAALLRAKPKTRDELKAADHLGGGRFEQAVESLIGRGIVTFRGEEVQFIAPERAIAELGADVIAEQLAQLADLSSLIHSLPGLAVASRIGAGENPDSVPTEIVHGTKNQWDLWMRLMGETPPRAPIAIFPDFPGLATFVIENQEAMVGASQALGFSIRTIVRSDALADPVSRAQLLEFRSYGIELRTLPDLPGWFYVDAGVLAALPLSWGEAVPSSVAIVREPALLAALSDYIETLWNDASPLPGDQTGWDQVLALLAQGMSDGAIASALGQSLRTVRRRIADAGEAWGAGSRFALGVEWERRRPRS